MNRQPNAVSEGKALNLWYINAYIHYNHNVTLSYRGRGLHRIEDLVNIKHIEILTLR